MALKDLIKVDKANKRAAVKGSKDSIHHQHEMFVSALKGHSDIVNALSWSSDGSSLVTACDDQTLRVFDTTDLSSKDPRVRRVNTSSRPTGVGFTSSGGLLVSLDDPPQTHVSFFAPNRSSKTTASNAAPFEETVTVKKIFDAKDQILKSVGVCPASFSSAAAYSGHGSGSGSASSSAGPAGGFIACLSTKKSVKVFDWTGKLLATLEPNSLKNHDLTVSADGRFLAVASFTSEVKVWEMTYVRGPSGSKEFKHVLKVMDLKGHRGQITSVALSPCGRRAATASLDGTLRIWNLDVRYSLGEDPKLLLTIPLPLGPGVSYKRMAYGANGIIAATAGDGRVQFLSAEKGDILDTVVAHDLPITALEWCPMPKVVLEKEEGEGEGKGGEAAAAAAAAKKKNTKRWVLATASEDKRREDLAIVGGVEAQGERGVMGGKEEEKGKIKGEVEMGRSLSPVIERISGYLFGDRVDIELYKP
eukprot:CAMPEP_0175077454 /NCGR_PEP_ID=MMETSP0052_2-20121109/23406_1 /TAXON_ID=51329 ORGANISM="Polytomella parva, Strain SAG 63-3" /NCGR_SAMPLE_ID=MMETSP0052_2 /ASSEMBLY_ACC=CAM_ASM_000194 /LENGTH=474 /DNA_ID=CAMNT_0016346935 /DNA_START=206 /DNA_END=1629 /DNA_ORIENTATION=+